VGVTAAAGWVAVVTEVRGLVAAGLVAAMAVAVMAAKVGQVMAVGWGDRAMVDLAEMVAEMVRVARVLAEVRVDLAGEVVMETVEDSATVGLGVEGLGAADWGVEGLAATAAVVMAGTG
ncbi:hypothetical protein Vafri_2321, partial [Volvox africanus]